MLREPKGPLSSPPDAWRPGAAGLGPSLSLLPTNPRGACSSGEVGMKHSIPFFWQQPSITVL